MGVNGGCTRPKGPGHPTEGLGVNCPPLRPSGHCSSPGGKAFHSSCAVYTLYTVQLMTSFAFHSGKYQLNTDYKSLVVQSKNCTTILDNCAA